MVYLLRIRNDADDRDAEDILVYLDAQAVAEDLRNVQNLFENDIVFTDLEIDQMVLGFKVFEREGMLFSVEKHEAKATGRKLHYPAQLDGCEAGIVHTILKTALEEKMPVVPMLADVWRNMLEPIIEKTAAR